MFARLAVVLATVAAVALMPGTASAYPPGKNPDAMRAFDAAQAGHVYRAPLPNAYAHGPNRWL